MTMKSRFVNGAVFAGALLLAGCATTPTTTPALDQARADFVAANNDPQIASYATLELKQATDALNAANQAAAKRDSLDTIDRLAYVAKQKIATAREVAKTKAAEAQVANAARERDKVTLEARAAAAERAKQDAQAQAASAQVQAAAAQAQAAAAQEQSRQLAERTAKLEALLADLHAVKTERGYVVTIGDVLFATDRATLRPSGLSTLRKLADVMVQNPDRSVLVEGFTDSTGSAAHNQELSERRAAAVANALAGMGVPRERIAMHAYGEAYPVAPNDTAAHRQLNRRVEIVLSNENQPIAPRAPLR
jgi:outer membrane protein OmpA-like peptidoglycan-associated protein